MSSCFFFFSFFLFCLSHPSKYELTSPKTNSQVRIQTHKTILDLIWLNVLRNSCTVPYLFTTQAQVWPMKNTIKRLLLELNCSLGELCCISLASRTGLVHFPDWPNWRTSNLFVSLIEILHHNHLNNPDWQENVKSG